MCLYGYTYPAVSLDDFWTPEILFVLSASFGFCLFLTTIISFILIRLIAHICILMPSCIYDLIVCRWAGLMHLSTVCVCVRARARASVSEAADMPSGMAIKVVWRGGVTLNDAWGSLLKAAALCGDCNTNEPLPVSYSTILEDAHAGGASLQVHCWVCACFAVLSFLRSHWAPIELWRFSLSVSVKPFFIFYLFIFFL